MTQPQSNLLAQETSPYLRQHKDNPVHWRPWNAAMLAEAQDRQRPILLSVGYSACHWCHVMAHECFEDDEVAQVMNRHFVNVKVDREERPDIDQIYMTALTAMGEQGGWPLTMFLTPEGKPFWGGTFFPKTPKYGRPGIIQILEAINAAWHDKTDDIRAGADTLNGHVRTRLTGGGAGPAGSDDPLPAYADAVYGLVDHERGGIRGAPKFPNAPFMDVLWMSWLQQGRSEHRDAVLNSLRHMLDGGIYDHVGGGLCRYSTDADWIVPHFEKMLYDNAQLIRFCGYAFAETGDQSFQEGIEDTIAWIEREILVDGGGFAASLDADTEGEEGKFYLWRRDQIESVLGPDDADRFLQVYELVAPPNWEGDPILRRAASAPSGGEDERLTELLSRLLAAREHRVRPGRDDKVLADWNGMAIAAIAAAARQFDRRDWLALAENAFRFVDESKDAAGRLPHSIRGETRLFPAFASDYAAMIAAAINLYEVTSNERYRDLALDYRAKLDSWYPDANGTGYYLTASDSADTTMRIRDDVDDAVPSATAQTIAALSRLCALDPSFDAYEAAWSVASHALGRIAELPYGQAGIIAAAAGARQPMKLVIVEAGEPSLRPAADRRPDPRRTDIPLKVSDEATVSMPDGTVADTNRPGAWLCIGQTCLPPIHDPAELCEALTNVPLSSA